jgi:transcription elongation factor Elf1
MKDIGDIKPLKPYKPFKEDPDPRKQDITCNFCGSTLKSPDPQKNEAGPGVCPNCGKSNTQTVNGFHGFQPDPKGKQQNPYSTNKPMYVERGGPMVPMADNNKEIKTAKKIPKVKDEWISEEFKQLKRPKRKNNDVIDIDEIEQTCKDLAIDG